MTNFEKLEVYQLAVRLSGIVWEAVVAWEPLARRTVGGQLVRAADSVGANIAEGAGRGSRADYRRCLFIARGSLYETKHWLRLARQRGLLSSASIEILAPLLTELLPKLNALIASVGRKTSSSSIKEAPVAYGDSEPFGDF